MEEVNIYPMIENKGSLTLKIGQSQHTLKENGPKTTKLTEAHNRANEQNMQNRRRRRPPVTGSVRLSNTDSIGRANRIRQRLRAKMGEIMSSSLDEDVRKSLARTVQLQLDRVEGKIRQIRRRERAQQEEKRDRASAQRREEDQRIERQREERRRRRQSDLRQRSIRVRRDFLYSANQGGFNPYNNNITMSHPPSINGPAVAIEIGGYSGVVMDSAPPPNADVVNMLL